MIAISLEGKTAIVTGASQGLGEATVKKLHEAGASVVINYYPDAEEKNLTKANAIAVQLGERVLCVACDVRDKEAVRGLFEKAILAFGGVDIVINNAAVLRDKTIKKMSDEDWQVVLDTNLTGVFHVCRMAAETLRPEGRIVNLGSIAASLGFFGQANYSAAKAGVEAMTRVLARELAKKRITVNAVAPGVVLTEMGKSIPNKVQMAMMEQIPLERFGEPNDIAHAILFLCSPLASYITGQTLHVNGGWYA
ncbi:MAG: SDR family oxidoreductase [Gemmataceae bacterium]|nr:SDR family oxidoreductase [Gemmataceae bacterium]